MKTFLLENKLALITGGGSGIGFGVAQAFIAAGARVVLTGRRKDALERAVAELGPRAQYIVNDVTRHKMIPPLVAEIERDLGPIDILVNNAGAHLKKEAQQTSDDEFLQVINTNLLSVFSLTRSCADYMIRRQRGCILMISSMTALFGMDRVVAYGTSKAALTGMIRNLVCEYSLHNVRINAVAPGWIESDMFLQAVGSDPDRKRKIENRIAMNHFGKPEDIGHAAVFLCSDAARYVTGVVLPVDGGATVNF
ncbi:MAG TPA: glucose 1-dehydrogenase [Anseongella sp.]